LSDISVCR